MVETRSEYKKRRRAELFAEQNGLCFWCETPMRLLESYAAYGGTLLPGDCTLDHLRDRNDPTRRQLAAPKEKRWVAACYSCNSAHNRSPMRAIKLKTIPTAVSQADRKEV